MALRATSFVEQSVETWSSNEDGCIMIALSPVLLDHEVRLVLTYQPSAPLLSSCLEFNSPSKDCVVHALRCLHGMEHRRREKILGDVVD